MYIPLNILIQIGKKSENTIRPQMPTYYFLIKDSESTVMNLSRLILRNSESQTKKEFDN